MPAERLPKETQEQFSFVLLVAKIEMHKDLVEQDKVPLCIHCKETNSKRCRICGECSCKFKDNATDDVCHHCIELRLHELTEDEIDKRLDEITKKHNQED